MVSKQFSNLAEFYIDKKGGLFHPIQVIGSLDNIYKTVELTEERLNSLGETLEKLTGGKFVLGPTKERDVAEQKVETELNGKEALLCDICRSKLIVDSPADIIALREILNPENESIHKVFKEHNTFCAVISDYFADPKLETG